MQRRQFLQAGLCAALAASVRAAVAADKRAPKILIRSAWQTVNIGDIAHTPGLLAILEKYLPEAELTLWPRNVDMGVDQLILRRFPKLKITRTDEDRVAAFRECDFLLHGSAASLSEGDVRKWIKETGKPFGIYGVGVPQYPEAVVKLVVSPPSGPSTIEVLNQAKFVFFRDSVSMRRAQELGCRAPIMEYGPDAAFATDLTNDAAAEAFLKSAGLEAGKFLCCIPRLRISPYWKMKPNVEFHPGRHARNEEMKEHDHRPLREAITRIVRETEMKVLLCPEDSSHMELGREMLLEKLPADVVKRVAWRKDYWLTDEARSVYARSAGLFGNEMHSPIMCIGMGVPAIVCRWAEQTTKGTMWRDIGLADWVFDFDVEAEVARMPEAAVQMAKDPAAAKAKAEQARAFVVKRQAETMQTLRASLPK